MRDDVTEATNSKSTPLNPRRRALVLGASVFAAVGLLESKMSSAQPVGDADFKTLDVQTNGITLRVTDTGAGPAILFVHGFPDTSYTWRKQMKAVAAAGFRAIAPDMRGCGGSSAPADPTLYTPFRTVGDLVGLLDELHIAQAIIVGHDWGANVAWNATMMRPDRFKAVFCLAVPYTPRGRASVLDGMQAAGHGKDFYMFEQISPVADEIWANASVTIPGMLYWASGAAPADQAWDPFDPKRSLHRPAPGPLPSWVDQDYLSHNIAEYQRTGFHGALNYYRAVQPFFDESAAFTGAKISQPSYFIWGNSDNLVKVYKLTETSMRARAPELKGYVGIDGVGHWVQHEATERVNHDLVAFARSVG